MQSWTFDSCTLFLHGENDARDLPGDWLSLIAPHEHERAAKMGSPARAHTFLRTRALLRQKLAALTGTEPALLDIGLTPEGKPFLAAPRHDIAFSLSHSHGHILIGIAENGAIGVDLEYIDPTTDIEKIAHRVFTAEERRALADMPPEARRAKAFQIWCTKEARFKLGDAEGRPVKEQTAVLDEDFAYAVCRAENG